MDLSESHEWVCREIGSLAAKASKEMPLTTFVALVLVTLSSALFACMSVDDAKELINEAISLGAKSGNSIVTGKQVPMLQR